MNMDYSTGLTPAESELAMSMLGGSLILLILIGIAWGIVNLIAYWRVFSKAGEPGWKVLIPIYNVYTEFKFTWSKQAFLLWVLLLVVGSGLESAFTDNGLISSIGNILYLLGCIVTILSYHKLSVAFGHGIGFTIGLILLQPIFIMILGFGSSQYQGNSTRPGSLW